MMISKSRKLQFPKKSSGSNTSETNRNLSLLFERKDVTYTSNPSTRVVLHNNEKDTYSRTIVDRYNNLFSQKSFEKV